MPNNFITYWIRRGMQTDEERANDTREHMLKSLKGAEELKKRWDEPILGPGYWNTRKVTLQTKARLAEAKALPVSVYAQALADVQAGREAQGASK